MSRPKVRLRSPDDARDIIQKTISQIFEAGPESVVTGAGKISQLLIAYAKIFEVQKVEELEKRLEELEGGKK